MKKAIVGVLLGTVIGTGTAIASNDAFVKNGVTCIAFKGGVGCQLSGSKKLVMINHKYIAVGNGSGKIYYYTNSR